MDHHARKCYFNLSDIQQARNRRELRVILNQLSQCAEKMGLVINELKFIKKTNSSSQFSLLPKHFVEDEVPRVNDILFKSQKMRDLCHISTKKFTLIKDTMEFGDIMPGISKCDEMKKKISNFFELEENDSGFYLKDPIKKITLSIKKYYRNQKIQIQNGDNIYFKVACDGTNLTTKNIKQLNLTFTIINDKFNATAAKGHFILGMFKIDKEDYLSLKSCLSNIFEKLEKIKTISIKQKIINLEHFLGADMKGLAILYGINGANSNQPCVLCEWNKTNQLEINDIYKPRTLNNARSSIGSNGYINDPISYIDFDHCPIDMLHLFIRISEKLCDLVEEKLILFDGNSGSDISRRVEFKKWIDFWKDCNITNAFMKSKENIWLRRSNITGSEYLKFFQTMYETQIEIEFLKRLNFSIEENINDVLRDSLNVLFKQFYKLILRIKKFDSLEDNLEELDEDLKNWLYLYDNIINPKLDKLTESQVDFIVSLQGKNIAKEKLLYQSILSVLDDHQKNIVENSKSMLTVYGLFFNSLSFEQVNKINNILSKPVAITPYIHVFSFHITGFIRKYKNVNIFNAQGLEKLNDLSTIYYQRSTNKNLTNKKYLRQLIEKRNRIEFYQLGLSVNNIL